MHAGTVPVIVPRYQEAQKWSWKRKFEKVANKNFDYKKMDQYHFYDEIGKGKNSQVESVDRVKIFISQWNQNSGV